MKPILNNEINMISHRDKSMDLMKSVLVVLMIFAHIVSFFPKGEMAYKFADFVNLTTFSGFMFTFGYVSYKAYIQKENRNLVKNFVMEHLKQSLLSIYQE